MPRFSFKFGDPAAMDLKDDTTCRDHLSSEFLSGSPGKEASPLHTPRSSITDKKKVTRAYTTGSGPTESACLEELESFAKALRKTSPKALALALQEGGVTSRKSRTAVRSG